MTCIFSSARLIPDCSIIFLFLIRDYGRIIHLIWGTHLDWKMHHCEEALLCGLVGQKAASIRSLYSVHISIKKTLCIRATSKVTLWWMIMGPLRSRLNWFSNISSRVEFVVNDIFRIQHSTRVLKMRPAMVCETPHDIYIRKPVQLASEICFHCLFIISSKGVTMRWNNSNYK